MNLISHSGHIVARIVIFVNQKNGLDRVTAARINDVVRKRRSITADTALRLARYFGTDAQSWINLQAAYDLRVAELAAGETIERQVKPRQAA
ncbi:MAG TPA: HigA family addiction module antitoxin [Candidatus Sulfobium mesophilum]|nr:HigA family addiction module antitoxin [Candidatus Sulfobium mesophilum]